MPEIYYDADASLDPIRAVVWRSSATAQGHAHALSLHDSGADVRVGRRRRRSRAQQPSGRLRVLEPADACGPNPDEGFGRYNQQVTARRHNDSRVPAGDTQPGRLGCCARLRRRRQPDPNVAPLFDSASARMRWPCEP